MFRWATELQTPGSQPATHHSHPKPATFQDRSASRRATGAHSGQGRVRATKARGRARAVFGTRLPPHLLFHFMVPGNDSARGNSRVFLLPPFTLQLGTLRLRERQGKQAVFLCRVSMPHSEPGKVQDSVRIGGGWGFSLTHTYLPSTSHVSVPPCMSPDY